MISNQPQLSFDEKLNMLQQMQTIRRFEERASEGFLSGDIYGVVHCYIGEEAVAVGVCQALRTDDQIISTHRGHGHCIAKGADLNRMMAELYGRTTGYCKGKGGSMHIADFDIGMLGANGIVAGGLSIITGAGLAAQLDGGDRVAVGFFGDGASNAGPFHESINIAANWKLPVVYVCENNLWAVNTPASATVATPDVAARAAGSDAVGRTTRRGGARAEMRDGRRDAHHPCSSRSRQTSSSRVRRSTWWIAPSVHARPTTSLGNLLGVGKRPRGVLTREAYALDEMDAMRLTEANSSEALQRRVSGSEPLVTRSAADGDPVFASKRH